MKKYYAAPVAETVELLHNEVLMLSDCPEGADEKDNVTFESPSRQWSSDSWNDVDE